MHLIDIAGAIAAFRHARALMVTAAVDGLEFLNPIKVGDFIVFNIGGNKYRLITAIHFNRRKVYIRHVLTHQEYDRGAWKP